ncbi:PREDICTED: uncharacterized protein LOC109319943 [Crocodylus porosus]|uniref:uncharacterized protein LOC109319943 n=1 Tax=Crocodylus porosus TaxID=8502 RepID=UPI00093E63EF|nr:PREDICTED: uncharacterized protein LOC109319943 [Crocodylus porosus]XP_019405344.1 PREDICTED: uncharacterized protein LOC109319943 [Crocodylus porosus]XP_019405345.1 PREDICTED: uncharacterized protein LOC109319943 [Crocodylus porosus]
MWLFFIYILYLFLKPIGTIYGHNNYTEYQLGNMNIIISVPHGGAMEPEDIPDRDAGCWNANSSSCIFSHDCPPGTIQDFQKCKVATNQDRHVIEVGQTLAEEIRKITKGFFPHVVINHLQRFKMDANRAKEEATFGIPQAEEAWEDYMGFMRSAKLHMTEGLIVDIHGQAHPEQWIELGYTISKASLNSGLFSASDSSIQYLANQLGNVTFESLLRGHRSLGKFIEDQNKMYVCVPSPTNPSPKNGNYYSGGYITKTFGSRYSGTVDAIQIELPQWVRDIKESPKFSKALAKAIMNFWQTNYCIHSGHQLLGC